MRIAIVGAGIAGLSTARYLSDDPNHTITVLESKPWFGGRADVTDLHSVDSSVAYLRLRGVTLRAGAQVERLQTDAAGVDLWIHGVPERFDVAIVTASVSDAYALLDRSGVPRALDDRGGSVDPDRLAAPLRGRVYFAGSDMADSSAPDSRAALAHPNSPPDDRVARGLWWLSRRAGALVGRMAADVEFVDLSQTTWPLGAPAVYIANHRSLFDVPAGLMTFDRLRVFPRIVVDRKYFDTRLSRHLKQLGALPALRGTNATVTAAVAALSAGDSVAFMVEGRLTARDAAEHAPHGRGAALAALRTNAAIVPIAAYGTDDVWPSPRPWPLVRRTRPKVVVVIGTPFHPETSSIDELMDDMRTILLHLEGLAREHTCGPGPRLLERVA
jgi:1-acyl-sn-glycerol-3-phosphate acyltransferase